MQPEKAPGPDGFGPLFYQKNWEIVGDEVTRKCLQILNEDGPLDSINRTLVTLVPKCSNPEDVENFRPISLCNVLGKIVTKCLANRLKHVLHKVISDTQSAFVPNRLITDNILLAHKMFHYLNTRTGMFNGYGALKLDMSKVYDRVNWQFLENLQLRLGFLVSWVRKIIKCVTTVTCYFRVNDVVSEVVVPERGIRQGDPISPYLFIICMEWLAFACIQKQEEGRMVGVKICRSAPSISHLFFADDCLLFMKATLQNVVALKDILERFQLLARQKLNYDKSEMFFGKNVAATYAQVLCNFLGVKRGKVLSKYLGMPIFFKARKLAAFKEVEEKCWRRVHGWKEKWLSLAGKEILIKSILQDVPVFIMSCFKIHVELCKRLAIIIFSFWWGRGGEKRSICWVRREVLTETKLEGGMGFRCLALCNEALLFKQLCRLDSQELLLVSKVIRAKYFGSSSMADSVLGSRPSYAWRCLWEVKEKLGALGMVQRLEAMKGAGDRIRVRDVYDVLLSIRRTTTRNVRGESSDMESKRTFWKKFWRVKVQPKVKVFMWRVYHNALPTADNLSRRGCQAGAVCRVCGKEVETVYHVILYCDWAKEMWLLLLRGEENWREGCRDSGVWVWEVVRSCALAELTTISNGAYAAWMNRNSVWNGKEVVDVRWSVSKIKMLSQELKDRSFSFITMRRDPGICWRPPESGFVKINIDAAGNSDSGRTDVACVCRDETSHFLFVCAATQDGISSILEAEMGPLKMAMKAAERRDRKKQGCQNRVLNHKIVRFYVSTSVFRVNSYLNSFFTEIGPENDFIRFYTD
ncbi:hypothetical protein QQ045_032085 [Rhodiola kirilowii]